MASRKSFPIYDRIRQILESARTSVARSVNTAQVAANWLIGREIVEEEQRGKRRADYGGQLLQALSRRLQSDFGSGYAVDNLEWFRRFYLEYPELIWVRLLFIPAPWPSGGVIRRGVPGVS